jgi:hypothetical protein
MTQFLPAALLLKVFSSADGIHQKRPFTLIGDWAFQADNFSIISMFLVCVRIQWQSKKRLSAHLACHVLCE